MLRRVGILPAQVALTLFAICLPSLVLAFWLTHRAGGEVLARTQAAAATQAAASASAAEGVLAGPIQQLLWLALTPEVQAMLGPAGQRATHAEAALSSFLHRQVASLHRVAVYDADGRLIAAADRDGLRSPSDAHDAAWFVGAVSEIAIPGGLAPVHIAPVDLGQPRLRYACALLRSDNAIGGVALVEADLGDLMAGVCGSGRLLLNGTGKALAGQPLGEAVISGDAAVRIRGQPAVHWRLRIDLPRSEALAGLRQTQRALAAATLLAMLCAAVVALLAVRAVSRPLSRLAEHVRTLGRDGFDKPMPDCSGPREIVSIAGAVEDLRNTVQERNRDLAERTEHLRVVAEFAADWELWLAPDGRCLHCSPSCLAIAGHPAEAFLGNPELLWSLVDPRDLPELRAALAYAGFDSPHIAQWRLLHDGGRWIELVVRRVRGNTGEDRGWRATLRDITARRELEHKLHHAQRVQEIGRMAGGVAHDFNNLLAVISGQAEMLRQKPEQTDRIDRLLTAVGRGAGLTKQLLVISRQQASDPTSTDVCKLVRETVDMLARTLGDGIAIELVACETPVWSVCDRIELGQVIMNLVVNARDAMPRGGTVRLTVAQVPDHQARLWAEIQVRDTGVGMDEATLERIFEPYFTTKSVGKGTGLGLAIAQAIIEGAGGTLAVRSTLGVGTTFTIRLPICEPSPPTPTEIGLRAIRDLRGQRILLADDSRTLNELLAEALEAVGAVVTTARDGQEAVEVARHMAGLDLLVLDVSMPRLGGPEAAAAIRAQRGPVPVLFITGYSGDRHAAVAATVNSAVLLKPFKTKDLLLAAQALLAGPRSLP